MIKNYPTGLAIIFVLLSIIATTVYGDEEPEDESCQSLQSEFRIICLNGSIKEEPIETRAFCEAYKITCPQTLQKIVPSKPKNVARYCTTHLERYQYVCPDPGRFGKHSGSVVEFCQRYHSFCPNENLPQKPLDFKDKNATHIYIREHQYFCDLTNDFAKVYCFNPVIPRVPKYQFPCILYKIHCIDPLTQVVYCCAGGPS